MGTAVIDGVVEYLRATTPIWRVVACAGNPQAVGMLLRAPSRSEARALLKLHLGIERSFYGTVLERVTPEEPDGRGTGPGCDDCSCGLPE